MSVTVSAAKMQRTIPSLGPQLHDGCDFAGTQTIAQEDRQPDRRDRDDPRHDLEERLDPEDPVDEPLYDASRFNQLGRPLGIEISAFQNRAGARVVRHDDDGRGQPRQESRPDCCGSESSRYWLR